MFFHDSLKFDLPDIACIWQDIYKLTKAGMQNKYNKQNCHNYYA